MSEYLLTAIICFGLGFAVAYWFKGKKFEEKLNSTNEEAAHVIKDANRHADNLIKEANLEIKDKLLKMKSDFDIETKETRRELNKKEQRLMHKEERVEGKIEFCFG